MWFMSTSHTVWACQSHRHTRTHTHKHKGCIEPLQMNNWRHTHTFFFVMVRVTSLSWLLTSPKCSGSSQNAAFKTLFSFLKCHFSTAMKIKKNLQPREKGEKVTTTGAQNIQTCSVSFVHLLQGYSVEVVWRLTKRTSLSMQNSICFNISLLKASLGRRDDRNEFKGVLLVIDASQQLKSIDYWRGF